MYLINTTHIMSFGELFYGGFKALSKTFELFWSEEPERCETDDIAFWSNINSQQHKHCSLLISWCVVVWMWVKKNNPY